LRAKIRGAIGDARRVEGAGRRASATRIASILWPSYRWAGAIAAAAVPMIIVLVGGLRRTGSSTDDLIGNEIVASHVRSLMANHLADVISTNQHTVKPWFDGRIDFAPTVVDCAAQGFPLAGGRLDYIYDHPVAALVYRYHLHVINLFTWPIAHAADTQLRLATQEGYNSVHWTESGMEYWAVSDVAPPELERFAQLVRGGVRQ